jgi:putative phosphoesterase
MRILIISDTHTDSIKKLPKVIINEIEKSNKIIHAGDIDNYNLINEIKEINPEIYPVKGNMDINISPDLLPKHRILDVNDISIGIIHGNGSPNNLFNRLLFQFYNQNIIVFGHTHHPYCKTINDKLFINPGSVLHNRNINENSYAILEIYNNNDFNAEIKFISDC